MEQFFTKSGSTWSAAKTRIYVSGPSGVIGVFNHDANATSAASNTASWLLKDHLGSVDTVLTMVGTQVQAQRYSYDAWGQRRDAATWAVQDPATVSSTATDRGFTGHVPRSAATTSRRPKAKAMLDHLGLVHMFRVPQQRDDKTGPLAEPDHGRIYNIRKNIRKHSKRGQAIVVCVFRVSSLLINATER